MSLTKVPPPGGDQDRGPALLAVPIVFTTLALLATISRAYVRAFISRTLGWDDYTIFLAMIVSVVALSINIKQVEYGAGRHEYYLQPHQIQQELKWHAFSQFQLYICTALIKTSACLFLIRLVNKRVLVWLLYFLMSAVIAVNLGVLIVLVTQCRPLERVWNKRVTGKCWDVDVLRIVGWVAGGFAVATDFVCSILPSMFLRKVQIQRKTKVLICLLMATGLVATAFSILKMALLPKLGATDTTYSQTLIQVSAILEENIGIIAVNLPLVKSFFTTVSPSLHSKYSKLRYVVGRKLSAAASDSSSSLENGDRHSEHINLTGGGQKWGLRVPGNQIVKTITLSHNEYQTGTFENGGDRGNCRSGSEKGDPHRVEAEAMV